MAVELFHGNLIVFLVSVLNAIFFTLFNSSYEFG